MRALVLILLVLASSCASAQPNDAGLAAPPDAALPSGEVAFVLAFGEDHRAFVVLADEVDERWVYGATSVLSADELTIAASRRVNRARLPIEIAEALDERWTAYDGEGAACGGNLGEPIELRLIDSTYVSEDDERSPNEIAQAEEHYTRVVAAPLEAVCARSPLWAHREGRAPRSFFVRAGAIEGEESAAAIAALRALPAYAEIQSEYDEYAADPESESEDYDFPADWTAYDGNDVSVRRIRDARTDRELVLVSAAVGYGCGVFIGNLWAVFERAPDGTLGLVDSAAEPAPNMFIDVEGDDALERLTWDGLFGDEDGRSIQRDPWMCPC